MTTVSDEKRATLEALRPAAEWELASRSFVNFLAFVMILARAAPLLGLPGGPQPFEQWPYLMEMAKAFSENRLVVVLKARQLGFSWLVAAYTCWLMLFRRGSVVLLLSRGEKEAQALVEKVKFIYSNLPRNWDVPPLGKDSLEELTIPSLDSKVLALPSTKEAGRSETATLVVQDEADFHAYLGDNFMAVKPTIDGGGQMIMGSTSNKKVESSLFKENYRESPGNNWYRVFWPWNARPGRDEAWYERTKEDGKALAAELGLTPDAYMEQEYPASANEALAPSKALAYLDHTALMSMQDGIREPLMRFGAVNIYRKWRADGRYMCGTDTSHGVGIDYSASVVIEMRSGVIVADILDNLLEPESLAYETMEMLKLYRNPIWGIEDNERGEMTLRAAQAQQYPRIFHRESSQGYNRRAGWHTDGKSRWILWGELSQAIEAGQVTTLNAEGLTQMFSVIKNPKNQGRPEHMAGAHDDYPMAVGIAWQMRKHAFASKGQGVKLGRRW